jgi:hypothetical protein
MKKQELKNAMFLSAKILGMVKNQIGEEYYIRAIKEGTTPCGEEKAILHGECIGLNFAIGKIAEMMKTLVEKSKLPTNE